MLFAKIFLLTLPCLIVSFNHEDAVTSEIEKIAEKESGMEKANFVYEEQAEEFDRKKRPVKKSGKKPGKKPTKKPSSGASGNSGSNSGVTTGKKPAKKTGKTGKKPAKKKGKRPAKKSGKKPSSIASGNGSGNSGTGPSKKPVKKPAKKKGKKPSKKPGKKPAKKPGKNPGGGSATGNGEYIPGRPGGPWTEEEIDIVREKVFAFLDPHPDNIKSMFNTFDPDENDSKYRNKFGPVSESALLRLSFHDCIPYKDGTGGCDGCLNWKNMGFRYTSFANGWVPEEEKKPLLYYPPVQETDNNGLDRLVFYLEKLYTSTDWPASPRNLDVSLKASGKSRADLWQFAVNVALELQIERANYACKVDFNQRQQIPLLEGLEEGHDLEYGIWKCNIKLNNTFKFKYGRKDCEPSPDNDLPYVATKEESQVMTFGTAEEVLQGLKKDFGMTARDLIALTSIHSIVAHPNSNTMGTKYSWFGNSYISNMYYKMIANKPTYAFNDGSDVGFCCGDDPTGGVRVLKHSVGDKDGKPLATWAWRVGCNDAWNTTDHGPCVMRPTKTVSEEAPIQDQSSWDCYGGIDKNGELKVNEKLAKFAACKKATFTKEGIQKGGKANKAISGTAFNNMFGLPYEIGLYYKLDVKPDTKRAHGCPGINGKYEDFPYDTDGGAWGTFKQSSVMTCAKNDYAPEGEATYKIVDEYAEDHDVWASDFLEAWQRMQSNGYSNLKEAPQNSWLGYHSLSNSGIDLGGGFAEYIKENAPVVLPKFSDPEPKICGHSGGFNKRCKWTFSEAYARNKDDERNPPVEDDLPI